MVSALDSLLEILSGAEGDPSPGVAALTAGEAIEGWQEKRTEIPGAGAVVQLVGSEAQITVHVGRSGEPQLGTWKCPAGRGIFHIRDGQLELQGIGPEGLAEVRRIPCTSAAWASRPKPQPVVEPQPTSEPHPTSEPQPAVEPQATSEARQTCPACGAPATAGWRHCAKCGAALPGPRFCRSCGKPLSPQARFCASCGTPVSAPAANPAPPPS